MVKKIVAGFVGAALILISAAGYAQEKIAVVDIQRAILNSAYGKAELEKLENSAAYSALTAEFDSFRADLQALDSEAQANQDKWNNEQFAEYNKTRQFLQADLELNGRKIQAEQQNVVKSINAAMNQRAQAALLELVKEEGISLLLKTEALWFADPSHDITEKLALKLGN